MAEVVRQELVNTKEPIFEGGPTKGEVEAWKQQWGEVYVSTECGRKFIWRILLRAEYKELFKNNKGDNLWKEERVVERCLLWPQLSYDQLVVGPAGLPTSLADKIMRKSGFDFDDTSEPERL